MRTVMLQVVEAGPASVPPERLIVAVPPVADKVPPQPLVGTIEPSIKTPEGKMTVSARLASVAALGLFNISVKVVGDAGAIELGLTMAVADGGA